MGSGVAPASPALFHRGLESALVSHYVTSAPLPLWYHWLFLLQAYPSGLPFARNITSRSEACKSAAYRIPQRWLKILLFKIVTHFSHLFCTGNTLQWHSHFLFLCVVLLVSNASRIKSPQRTTHCHQHHQHAACTDDAVLSGDDDAYALTNWGHHDVKLSFLASLQSVVCWKSRHTKWYLAEGPPADLLIQDLVFTRLGALAFTARLMFSCCVSLEKWVQNVT